MRMLSPEAQGLQGLHIPQALAPKIPKTVTVITPETRPSVAKRVLGDAGPWFLFFFAIYIILLLKVITFHSFYDHIFFGFYSLLITTYILSRFVFSYLKKPVHYDATFEPSVTFVVPAMNEEDNIAETIRRFAEVDYPREKLEVILINDGSTDGTLSEMWIAADEISNRVSRVEIVEWDKNKGKRQGMAAGALKAKNAMVT